MSLVTELTHYVKGFQNIAKNVNNNLYKAENKLFVQILKRKFIAVILVCVNLTRNELR